MRILTYIVLPAPFTSQFRKAVLILMVLQLMPLHLHLVALFTEYHLMGAIIVHVGLHACSMDSLAALVGARDDSYGAFLLHMLFQVTQCKILATTVVWTAESCLFNDIPHHEVKGGKLATTEGAFRLVCTAIATEEALAALTLIGVAGKFVAASAFNPLECSIFTRVQVEENRPVVFKIVVFLRLFGH